jgi:CMP/dCMP kinase
MQPITIAIDGYSSCGKSTLAKALAVKLNYSYIDSGAMYRCVAYYASKNGLIEKDGKFNDEQIIKLLPQIDIAFKFNPSLKTNEVYLNGDNVEKYIRGMEISRFVSEISQIKEVREDMVERQRQYGKNKKVVMDGRDIGTNVFPDAELKLFMTADIDIRVQRRLDELRSKGEAVSESDVRKNLEHRDHEDTHRKENPLRKAFDAVVLDNSDLSKEAQLDFVLQLIEDLKLNVED